MLDIILIIITLLFIIFTFLIVTIWKKKHFVKEIYIEKAVSILFYLLTVAITIGLIIAYFVTTQENLKSWLFLVILLCMDILMLLVYAYTATACIYLKDNVLVKKNIFITKQITITKETTIKEKFDRRIIQSQNKKISINSRGFIGNILTLVGRIKSIID